jgi:hypothetical protein
MRLVSLSQSRANKKLGDETAATFRALLRDFEAAATFSEVPVAPLAMRQSNRILLTYSLNGSLVLEVEPRTGHEMTLQQWTEAHRFCLHRILDDSRVII